MASPVDSKPIKLIIVTTRYCGDDDCHSCSPHHIRYMNESEMIPDWKSPYVTCTYEEVAEIGVGQLLRFKPLYHKCVTCGNTYTHYVNFELVPVDSRPKSHRGVYYTSYEEALKNSKGYSRG